MKIVRSSLLVMGAAAVMASNPARAALIGPNVYTDSGLDTGGTRANIDIPSAVTLPAGVYTATSFTAQVGQAGDAQPFLATVSGTAGSGSETYTVIAAGSDSTFAAQTAPQTITFGSAAVGSDTFVVPVGGETVYAGFDNVTGPNPVTTDGGGVAVPGTDAHFNPGPLGATVGTTLVENQAGKGGSAYELNRRYDFAINVGNAVTPEPGSLGLLGLGSLLLLVRSRRRQQVRCGCR